MVNPVRSADRRTGALTRARVVNAAIDLLDAEGEAGLTFRALAARLGTGHGAIQWHVQNKAELLRAATAVAVTRATEDPAPDVDPRAAIHAVALGIYDAIEHHPWIARQLTQPPWQSTMLEVFERIGQQVAALAAAPAEQFTATSTLLVYVIGAGGQEAHNSGSVLALADRRDALEAVAAHWQSLDPAAYPFTRSMTEPLRTHDDRVEFLAGLDLILRGLTVPPTPGENAQDC